MDTADSGTTTHVVIRPATPADGHAVYVLDHRCWSPVSEVSERPDPPQSDSTAFHDERHRPEHMLVAMRESELLGWVRVLPPTPLPSNAHIRSIQGLQVAPEARGLGLGRALLHAAIAKARHEGAQRVTLRVLGGNTVARALYETAGFTVTGVQPREFLVAGRYEDDVLMGFEL
ncbi:GNAT family N-acetyltransferase [Streptacidiphilus pinicola]|uniref:GNAT family N-acetyltransferase n=1 Tax=Streptacidiphilus pinicola TaxID=2219663 RepID=A0A2X0IJF5_9ACTN|nr:GNAT family N-acetyltransferase [Streptacidiphilus pinicola]RAG83531.1 GNAT family N-acetyltransferase [Streptacidiphilus pinicola]